MRCDDSTIFTTHFTCCLPEANVVIQWNPATLQLPDDMKKDVLAYWDRLPKDFIFNGRLARLESWELKNSHCQFKLQPTDYRTLLYSNAHVDHIQSTWGRSFLSRTLGISAVVISSDDHLVFMKRSANVGEYPECFDVFGGHIDVPNGSAPNVFNSMAQELYEEVGLERHDYALHLIGLVEATPNQKPELIFKSDVSLTADDIVARTHHAQDNNEFSRVHTIGKSINNITHFLNENKNDFSPSAFAAFCVYMDSL